MKTNFNLFYFICQLAGKFYLLFRSNMFELADRLVGIYKTDNCTKSVTINPHLLEETVPVPSQPNLTVIQPSQAKTVSRSALIGNQICIQC